MFFSIINTFVTAFIYFNFSINKKIFSPTLQFIKVHDFCKITKNKYCLSGLFHKTKQSDMISVSQAKNNMKRTSLSTLSNGIITIEASIAITIFALSMFLVLSLFNILYVQNIYSEKVSELLRGFSENAYITDLFSSSNDSQSSESDTAFNLEIPNNMVVSIADEYLIKTLFVDDSIKKLTESNYITRGVKGLDFSSTYYNEAKGILTISLSYSFTFPFLDGAEVYKTSLSKSIKVFNGIKISSNKSDTDFYVYMSLHGNVYHTNRYCSYLVHYTDVYDLNTHPVMNGPRCERCKDLEPDSHLAYITKNGDVYHLSLDCPTFQRDIYAIKYSTIQSGGTSYKICERCKGHIS